MSLSDAQKELRKHGVGGSEIAALVLDDHFMRPIDIYASKVEGREVEDNFHMERGRFYERPTADWWAHRRNGVLREPGTLRDSKHPIVIATPDFIGTPDGEHELDLSIKVPSPRTRRYWGKAGSDEVPAYALLQVQWEMIPLNRIYGITRAEVAAPLDGDLCIFGVDMDAEIQSMLIEAAERFWREHVIPRIPPEPDASSSYTGWLKARYPTPTAPALTADEEAERWARELAKAKKALKEAEEAEALARNNLLARIGNATAMVGHGWRASNFISQGRSTTDWRSLCAAAKIPESLVEAHTKRKQHSVFRFTAQELDDE